MSRRPSPIVRWIPRSWPALDRARSLAEQLHVVAAASGPERAAAEARATVGLACVVTERAWWTWSSQLSPLSKDMTTAAIAAARHRLEVAILAAVLGCDVRGLERPGIAARREEAETLVRRIATERCDPLRASADRLGIGFARRFPLRGLVKRLGPVAAPLLADVREMLEAAGVAADARSRATDLAEAQHLAELKSRFFKLAAVLVAGPVPWSDRQSPISAFWRTETGWPPGCGATS